MAELTDEERLILTCWAEGDSMGDAAAQAELPRPVVSNLLGRLCHYNRDVARQLVNGGPAAASEPIPKSEKAAASEPIPKLEKAAASEPIPKSEKAAASEPIPKKRGRPRKTAVPVAPLAPAAHGPLVDPIVVPGAADGAFRSVPASTHGNDYRDGWAAGYLRREKELEQAYAATASARAELLAAQDVIVGLKANVGELTEQLGAKLPEPVLARYVQWWCFTCYGHYSQPYEVHGTRCDQTLKPVVVTVTPAVVVP